MKGLFLLLTLSCDLNINTVPLSLVAQFIDAISLSEEPVRALAPPGAESKWNSAPSHQAVSSSTNWTAQCTLHHCSFLKGNTNLQMDEKRVSIWEGLMHLTWKLSMMICLFPHRYKLYLWIYSSAEQTQHILADSEIDGPCVPITRVGVMQLRRQSVVVFYP